MSQKRQNYPTVNQIIRSYYDESKNISFAALNIKAEREANVIKSCLAYAAGTWDPDLTVEDKNDPYITSFALWCDEHVESVILRDQMLYDDNLKLSGLIDLVVKLKDGSTALIDLKINAGESMSWALQLALEDKLLKANGYNADKIIALKLDKTGCIAQEISDGYAE